MGMIWVARLANDNEVKSLVAKPDLIVDFVNPEVPDKHGTTIDLDKEWHAIHFLLTGSAGPTDSPLSLILGNYQNVGPDIGYGPAFQIPKLFLKAFDHAISALSSSDLRARYDVKAMVNNQVYIADSLADEGQEALEYLLKGIERLREFASKGVAQSMSAFALIT